MKGSAELFGTELVLSRPYTFIGTKAAVYTWTGCVLEASYEAGALISDYIAEETTMTECINTHFALETMRERAEQRHAAANGQTETTTGPRLLIVGPDNAGKTTLAKTLTAYAIRNSRSPVVINIDPSEGVLSLPGTLSATVFKTLLEIESDAGGGWGTSPMSGPNGEIPVKLPLVYYFGGTDPTEKKAALYKAQVTRLALSVQGRMSAQGQEDVRASGIIVDTPGSLVMGSAATNNYELLSHVVSEFQINTVACLGSERLYNDMVKKFDKQPSSLPPAPNGERESIAVIKLPKSGGVVDRDLAYMRALREAQVKSYFYGNPKLGAGISLQPRQQPVEFESLPTLWRRISSSSTLSNFGGSYLDDDTFLPGGSDDTYEPTMNIPTTTVPLPDDQLFERMTSPNPALKHCVLAVMNCAADLDSANEQQLLRDASVMGFLYITDVDEARGRLNLLSPVVGRVPDRALVWGEGIEGIMGVVS